ncbi:hypothetical protein KC906_04480, partial [Candidatus Kaiserbacteria bacterium]|nr:hypothetical protein [Candidatus Kaiserbacteria bacterium]
MFETLRQQVSLLAVMIVACFVLLLSFATTADAANVREYRDLISDSGPLEYANHTVSFVVLADLSPGSMVEITMPPGFTAYATSSFQERNVQMYINGTPRTVAAVAAPGVDQVEITTGATPFIRYTLAPDLTINSGSRLEFRVG